MPGRLHDAARAYAQHQWPVFPLRPGGKDPIVEGGFKAATTDQGRIDSWWGDTPDANIGVPCGEPSGLIVLDIDNRDSLSELEADHGDLPLTLIAQTGGQHRGLHMVFQRPAGGLRKSASKLAPGVDVQGEGSYIVVAPSHVESEYQWVNAGDPEPLPEWVGEALKPRPRESGPPPTVPTRDGDADKWGQAVLDGEVDVVRSSTPNMNRNVNLFCAACNVSEAVKGGHLNEHTAWQALADAADTVGLPPGEAERTMLNAWGRTDERHPAERAADDRVPEQQPTPAPAPAEPAGGGRRSRLMGITDLRQMPPARWLIDRTLPEGFTILFGWPESGKTFISLDWALTLAGQGHPVVYAAGEGVTGLVSRIDAWCEAHPGFDPVPNMNLLALGSFPELLKKDSVRELHRDMEQLARPPVLFVLDTWARSLIGGDENSYTDVQQGIHALDSLRDKFGCNVLVIHHAADNRDDKGNYRRPKRPRGHTSLDGAADAMWRVDPPKEGDQFPHWKLVCTKCKDHDRPKAQKLQMVQQTGSLVVTPSAAGDDRNAERARENDPL